MQDSGSGGRSASLHTVLPPSTPLLIPAASHALAAARRGLPTVSSAKGKPMAPVMYLAMPGLVLAMPTQLGPTCMLVFDSYFKLGRGAQQAIMRAGTAAALLVGEQCRLVAAKQQQSSSQFAGVSAPSAAARRQGPRNSQQGCPAAESSTRAGSTCRHPLQRPGRGAAAGCIGSGTVGHRRTLHSGRNFISRMYCMPWHRSVQVPAPRPSSASRWPP